MQTYDSIRLKMCTDAPHKYLRNVTFGNVLSDSWEDTFWDATPSDSIRCSHINTTKLIHPRTFATTYINFHCCIQCFLQFASEWRIRTYKVL